MKKFLILGCCTCIGIGTANAAMSVKPDLTLKCTITTCSGVPNETGPYSLGCASTTNTCYKNSTTGKTVQVTNCTACKSGTGTELTNRGFTSSVCETTYLYQDCTTPCPDCTDCTSDTSWSSGNIGYQKKVSRTCSCGTCVETPSYRCAAGYYGSSSNGTSGCTRCPSSGGVYGTSAAGSTAITSCYIPSGTSMTDDTGTYQFTSSCYYTN